MNRKLAVAVASLGIAALGMAPALAGGNGAQKGQFMPTSQQMMMDNCSQRPRMATNGPDFGFAIVNLVGKPGATTGPIQLETSLKNGEPNDDYTVYIKNTT